MTSRNGGGGGSAPTDAKRQQKLEALALAERENYRQKWKNRLQRDPRPTHELDGTTSEEELEIVRVAWYGRLIREEPEVYTQVVENFRFERDWFYRTINSMNHRDLRESNRYVREMCAALLAWYESLFDVANLPHGNVRAGALTHVQNMVRVAELEMEWLEKCIDEAELMGIPLEHYTSQRLSFQEKPRQLFKHTIVYTCMVLYPAVLKWMCYGDPETNTPGPGVADPKGLETFALNTLRPQLFKLFSGQEKLVLDRFVYDARAGYIQLVGVPTLPLNKLEWVIERAGHAPTRRFIDEFVAERTALINAPRLERAHEKFALTQLEARRAKTRGAQSETMVDVMNREADAHKSGLSSEIQDLIDHVDSQDANRFSEAEEARRVARNAQREAQLARQEREEKDRLDALVQADILAQAHAQAQYDIDEGAF